jgi:hypothetical protein
MNINTRYSMCSFVLYVFIFYLLVLSGCAPAMIDKSFKGKVINEKTKEPVEGAVALAIWTTWMMTPAGEVDQYYDSYETVTDQNGDFTIQGKGPRVATNLNPMQVTVFKAGYMASSGTLKSYSQYSVNKNAHNDRLIIPLKKLTLEERKKMRGPLHPPIESPLNKVRNYLIELDRDSVERGFPPRREWHGEIYYDEVQK